MAHERGEERLEQVIHGVISSISGIPYDLSVAYSNDLRTKALDYLARGGSREEVSRIFGVTTRTLFNWMKRKEAGCLAPSPRKERTPHKVDSERLKSYLQEHPDAYLREIAEFFGATVSAIFYACRRLKITLKKRSPSSGRGMKKSGKNFRKD